MHPILETFIYQKGFLYKAWPLLALLSSNAREGLGALEEPLLGLFHLRTVRVFQPPQVKTYLYFIMTRNILPLFLYIWFMIPFLGNISDQGSGRKNLILAFFRLGYKSKCRVSRFHHLI